MNAHELELLLTRIVNEALAGGVSLKLTVYILVLLAAGASTVVGSYLAAYARIKGHNLATQEDLEKLLEQTRETAYTTKTIEARISHMSRVSESRWDLKKEYYLELLDCLAAIERLYSDSADLFIQGDSDGIKEQMLEQGRLFTALNELDLRGCYLLPLRRLTLIPTIRRAMAAVSKQELRPDADQPVLEQGLREIARLASRGAEYVALTIRRDLFDERLEDADFAAALRAARA